MVSREIDRRMPTAAKLTMSDEPPALTNGSGIPFVGISPSTTLMFTNACTAIIVVNPSARNAPNRSGASTAARSPRHVMSAKHKRMAVAPRRPSSSAITA